MTFMGRSVSVTRRCGHAIGLGVCACCIGLSAFWGAQPPRLEMLPSATVQIKPYVPPGKLPWRAPDDGHYDVSTNTSTGAVTGAAWGHALLPPGLPYPTTTNPTSGYVLKGDGSATYVALTLRSS